MNAFLTDTHCHIYEPEFRDDLEEAVQRALDSGVKMMLLPAVNPESLDSLLDVYRRWPDFTRPMIGLHPEDMAADCSSQLAGLKRILDEDRRSDCLFVGIGEIGIDLHWDSSRLDDQIRAYREQLDWALEYDLPVAVHCRDAHDVMVRVMEPYLDTPLRGVFHCFSGTAAQAGELLSHKGFMLGIGGVLTYRKSPLPETLESVPRDRVILETDSPYLPPVPYRGKRNEPSYLIYTAQFLAGLWGVGLEETAALTTANAKRLFRI